jgi:hypothetical protein
MRVREICGRKGKVRGKRESKRVWALGPEILS